MGNLGVTAQQLMEHLMRHNGNITAYNMHTNKAYMEEAIITIVVTGGTTSTCN